MSWNVPVYDSTGKVKDARLGAALTASGSPAIDSFTASGSVSLGFPDENTTGWAHTGVTLTEHASSYTLSTADAVYDSVLFNGSVTIAANNITIKRSQINGIVDNAANYSGLLLEDVLIDGQNGGVQAVGRSQTIGITNSGFTLRRVHGKNANQIVYASQFICEDCYFENINGDDTDHIESILGTGPGPMTVTGCTIIGEANSASGPWNPSDGGVSSAVSFYVHGSFWDDITEGILFENNYLRADPSGGSQAGFALYGGGDTEGGSGTTINGIFKNNTFARGVSGVCGSAGPVTAPADGTGSCWSNNKYDDGTPITVSGVPACP